MSDSYRDYCDMLAEEEKKRISSKKVSTSEEVKTLVNKFNVFAKSAFEEIDRHVYRMNFGLVKDKVSELRNEVKELVERLG